jgi:hypothetical protein
MKKITNVPLCPLSSGQSTPGCSDLIINCENTKLTERIINNNFIGELLVLEGEYDWTKEGKFIGCYSFSD